MSAAPDGYPARLARLARRWDPRGVLVSEERAQRAARLLEHPEGATVAQISRAHTAVDGVLHPVLGQVPARSSPLYRTRCEPHT